MATAAAPTQILVQFSQDSAIYRDPQRSSRLRTFTTTILLTRYFYFYCYYHYYYYYYYYYYPYQLRQQAALLLLYPEADNNNESLNRGGTGGRVRVLRLAAKLRAWPNSGLCSAGGQGEGAAPPDERSGLLEPPNAAAAAAANQDNTTQERLKHGTLGLLQHVGTECEESAITKQPTDPNRGETGPGPAHRQDTITSNTALTETLSAAPERQAQAEVKLITKETFTEGCNGNNTLSTSPEEMNKAERTSKDRDRTSNSCFSAGPESQNQMEAALISQEAPEEKKNAELTEKTFTKDGKSSKSFSASPESEMILNSQDAFTKEQTSKEQTKTFSANPEQSNNVETLSQNHLVSQQASAKDCCSEKRSDRSVQEAGVTDAHVESCDALCTEQEQLHRQNVFNSETERSQEEQKDNERLNTDVTLDLTQKNDTKTIDFTPFFNNAPGFGQNTERLTLCGNENSDGFSSNESPAHNLEIPLQNSEDNMEVCVVKAALGEGFEKRTRSFYSLCPIDDADDLDAQEAGQKQQEETQSSVSASPLPAESHDQHASQISPLKSADKTQTVHLKTQLSRGSRSDVCRADFEKSSEDSDEQTAESDSDFSQNNPRLEQDREQKIHLTFAQNCDKTADTDTDSSLSPNEEAEVAGMAASLDSPVVLKEQEMVSSYLTLLSAEPREELLESNPSAVDSGDHTENGIKTATDRETVKQCSLVESQVKVQAANVENSQQIVLNSDTEKSQDEQTDNGHSNADITLDFKLNNDTKSSFSSADSEIKAAARNIQNNERAASFETGDDHKLSVSSDGDSLQTVSDAQVIHVEMVKELNLASPLPQEQDSKSKCKAFSEEEISVLTEESEQSERQVRLDSAYENTTSYLSVFASDSQIQNVCVNGDVYEKDADSEVHKTVKVCSLSEENVIKSDVMKEELNAESAASDSSSFGSRQSSEEVSEETPDRTEDENHRMLTPDSAVDGEEQNVTLSPECKDSAVDGEDTTLSKDCKNSAVTLSPDCIDSVVHREDLTLSSSFKDSAVDGVDVTLFPDCENSAVDGEEHHTILAPDCKDSTVDGEDMTRSPNCKDSVETGSIDCKDSGVDGEDVTISTDCENSDVNETILAPDLKDSAVDGVDMTLSPDCAAVNEEEHHTILAPDCKDSAVNEGEHHTILTPGCKDSAVDGVDMTLSPDCENSAVNEEEHHTILASECKDAAVDRDLAFAEVDPGQIDVYASTPSYEIHRDPGLTSLTPAPDDEEESGMRHMVSELLGEEAHSSACRLYPQTWIKLGLEQSGEGWAQGAAQAPHASAGPGHGAEHIPPSVSELQPSMALLGAFPYSTVTPQGGCVWDWHTGNEPVTTSVLNPEAKSWTGASFTFDTPEQQWVEYSSVQPDHNGFAPELCVQTMGLLEADAVYDPSLQFDSFCCEATVNGNTRALTPVLTSTPAPVTAPVTVTALSWLLIRPFSCSCLRRGPSETPERPAVLPHQGTLV
ncbi:hypothetical protein WMY93_029958 [Mugilogobius chulae]|uniref:Uncharacterized protein n=1 Tax=Mugilogobius chulae TaxID=88201 RepID=A0AAW0MUC8_9GOBI